MPGGLRSRRERSSSLQRGRGRRSRRGSRQKGESICLCTEFCVGTLKEQGQTALGKGPRSAELLCAVSAAQDRRGCQEEILGSGMWEVWWGAPKEAGGSGGRSRHWMGATLWGPGSNGLFLPCSGSESSRRRLLACRRRRWLLKNSSARRGRRRK